MFNIFKKKKENTQKGDQYISLKIREIVKETPDTVTVYFEQPEPFLEYKPGQFLTVILEIDGKEFRRSYSLCTSPYVDPYPGITVKRLKNGVVSNYLNDQLRPGKTLEVMKPMGNFSSTFHSKNKNHFVMITGGSGITPIMGITKSVLINEPESKITLLYCSRSEEQIIFKKELDQLQEKYSDRLLVLHNLTKPTSDWTGEKGRLDKPKITTMLKSEFFPEAEQSKYYLCGPEGLMDTALDTLLELGIDKENIFKESFYTSDNLKEKVLESAGKTDVPLTREVEVTVDGQSFTFEVPPGQTILESGLDNDVNMPYSCQSGLCTACRGRLLSGKVDMIEDAGLSEGEIAEGYILCCSSKPASSDIKILID